MKIPVNRSPKGVLMRDFCSCYVIVIKRIVAILLFRLSKIFKQSEGIKETKKTRFKTSKIKLKILKKD